MTEKHLQSLFGEWIRKNPPDRTSVYELKFVKGNAMPFDRVRSHQLEALIAASHKGLHYKISDSPVSWKSKYRFTKPKPFDSFYVRDAVGCLVICFYKPRHKKRCMFILADTFREEQRRATRKSLTEERAAEISFKIAMI